MTSIERIAKEKIIDNILRNMRVDNNYFDDLKQDITYILITGYTEETLEEAINNNQIKYIVASIANRQYNSKSSPFYRIYRKFSILGEEIKNKHLEIADD